MQFSLMLGLLLTILAERRVSREYLAEKFEISQRTVTRYLNVIAEAGVPIESVAGKGGGIRVPDTYRLDRSFFSKEELKRLSTCLRAMQTSFSDSLNVTLQDKIKCMAQNREDEKYLLKSDTLIIDMGTWTNPEHYRNKIEVINKAIAHDLTLELVYTDRNEFNSERVFDPYSLVLKEGMWYVYGFCHLRSDFRLFKLSRIKHMLIGTRQFVRKESNVYEKLHEVFVDKDLVQLEFEFHSTVLAEIEDWLGTDCITDHGQMYNARALVYGGSMLINKLLSFGSSLRVLSPAALREELIVECARIARNYE